MVDTDGDRLADSVETNTGVFVSAANTGTDPRKADTDGDAIKDGDEVLGTTAGLDLAALGFRALHKDLAVEFDWYDDTAEPDACGAGTHSHRPAPDSIAEIAAAYANAPVSNPDGTTGINFIADYGQGGVFVGGNFVPGPADGVIAADGVPGNSLAGEYNVVKNANFASSRNGYFHYLFSAHKNEGSDGSGGGELLGDDVLSVDGCYFSDHHDVANLVFHELGHNLSLRHGGFEDPNFKPNYNSVMNYGITGVDTNCDGIGDNVLGYSSGTNIDLDENALVEANGTCGPGHPIDWNKNGSIDAGPIAYNLNPEEGPGLTVLKDNDDWAQISFAGLTDAD